MSVMQRFRADIQGLRAIAVTSVVLHHASSEFLPGGYVGVDIFFVISGFLITRILLRELDAGTYSIAEFYVRRIKRLFPALYLMLAATLAVGFALLPPDQLAELSLTVISTALFSSNLLFIKITGYFASAAELKPLLHTWSLAVEEQFYLAFPPALAFLARRRREWVIPALWVGFLASLLLCEVVLEYRPSEAFYLPLTRAFELLTGCLLAAGAVPTLRSDLIRNLASVAGLAMITLAIALYEPSTRFPGILALVPCVGTALVIYAGNQRDSLAGTLIGGAVPCFIGNLSYSWYLWHWPVFCYLRWITIGSASPLQIAAATVLSFGLGYASWQYVELPAQRFKITGRNVLLSGVATILVTCIVCVGPVVLRGLPDRFTTQERALLASEGDFNHRRSSCHSEDWRPVAYRDSCVFGASASPTTAVYGDSFGAEIVAALGERLQAQSTSSAIQITSSACPPAAGYRPPSRPRCTAYNKTTLELLANDQRIKTVVLIANYNIYPRDDLPELLGGLTKTAATLKRHGKRVAIIYQVPSMHFVVPTALALVSHRGQDPTSYGIELAEHERETADLNTALDAIVARTGAIKIDPARDLCVGGLCKAYLPAFGSLYFDRLHLSMAGARLVVGKPAFDALARSID